MADYSIPLQVNQPTPFTTLNNLLSTATGLQEFQKQNIQLQAQRQANEERKNFISLMQQDPTMRPQPDGTFDLGPANSAKIMAAMPQTGADQISKLADTNQRMTQARQSVFDLGVSNAKAFGQAVNDLAGSKPSERVARLDELSQQFPGTKPFNDIYQQSLSHVSNMPGSDAEKAAALQNLDQFWSRWHMDVQSQQTAGTPTTLGVGSKFINIKPGVAGQPVGSEVSPTTLGPGELQSTVFDAQGNPFKVIKNAQGAITGLAPIAAGGGARTGPAAPAAPGFQNKVQAADVGAAQQETQAVRSGDSNPVSGYQPTRQIYTNLLDLAQKNPAIGPGSAAWNQLTAALTPFGASPNSKVQEIGSYLDRLALANAGAAGLSTDAARSMMAGSVGTTSLDPEALKEKLRFGAATLEAAHAYRTGLDATVGTSGQQDFAQKRAFDAAWTQNADILAFRLQAAKNHGDQEGYQRTLGQIKGLPLPQQQLIFQHAQNLNRLTAGQIPQ